MLRRWALVILFPALASPTWANTYFLAPAGGGGSDSNNGTSLSTSWLTPNHSVNCGDTITAAASTAYDARNFTNGKWGTVSCAAGNNVAWLKCVTFDACKITTSTYFGMFVSASYWGVQGWEVTTSGTNTAYKCFGSSPSAPIHHIIFANNIANGCQADGISGGSGDGVSVGDYIAIVGNIVHAAAQSSASCYAGIKIGFPVQLDSLPGTHIYIAQNFTWDNVVPNPCGGFSPPMMARE